MADNCESFNGNDDSFPLLPKADVAKWNEKAGLRGTKSAYTGCALDTNGFPDDSVTGDCDCGF